MVDGDMELSASSSVGKMWDVQRKWLVSLTIGVEGWCWFDVYGVPVGICSSYSYSCGCTLTILICGLVGGGSGSGCGGAYS